MKQFWVSLAVLGLVFSVTAQARTNNPQTIQTTVAKLEHEVQDLESEVKDLKKSKQNTANNDPYAAHPYAPEKYHSKQPHPIPQSIGMHPRKVQDDHALQQQRPIFYFGGMPVITSPFIGVRSRFDASDLIVNLPSVNEDLRLLRQRKKIETALRKNKLTYPQHPILDISGKVEGIAQYAWPYSGSDSGDIDVASAEVEFLANINRWVLGFIAVDFDSSRPGSGINGPRTGNSRFFLNKGFVTVGNLMECPWYFTIGQFFVPFGRDASNMLSSPLPLTFGRTKARAALVGFQQMGEQGFYAQGYMFRSDSDFGSDEQGGANLGYQGKLGPVSAETGVSYISTITDASGQQLTGGSGFSGFAGNIAQGSEDLNRRVPGFAFYGVFGLGHFSLITEYAIATRKYNKYDLTFNNGSAQPYASNIELGYEFHCHDKPASIAFGYGRSGEALALNIPRERFMTALNISIWEDTIETLEYRHDNNYKTMIAAGRTQRGNMTPTPINYPGRHADVITAQIGIYF